MFYQEFKPSGQLKKYIRCIWIQESNAKSNFPEKEKILPDGCVELIFHYGVPFRTYFPDHSYEIQPRGFMVTQMNHYIEIQPTGPIGIIAVRFFPWGAYRFLGIPIKEVHDQVIDVQLIWNQVIRDIQDKICEARGHTERLKIVRDFLYSRLAVTRNEDLLVDHCLNRIHHSDGQLSIKSLSAAYNISTRQLERRFINSAGTSPKHFSRITRFLNACKLMRQGNNIQLTHIAQEFGYFDQSHFIREFKAFSGVTPKTFLSDNNISFVEI